MSKSTYTHRKGQETGYYLPISDDNRLRLIVFALMMMLSFAWFTAGATPYNENITIIKTANEPTEKAPDSEFRQIYKDLEPLRLLMDEIDHLRESNRRMTSGPVAVLSRVESNYVRQNSNRIKELEKEVEKIKKDLFEKHLLLARVNPGNQLLIKGSPEELEAALSDLTLAFSPTPIILLSVVFMTIMGLGISVYIQP